MYHRIQGFILGALSPAGIERRLQCHSRPEDDTFGVWALQSVMLLVRTKTSQIAPKGTTLESAVLDLSCTLVSRKLFLCYILTHQL